MAVVVLDGGWSTTVQAEHALAEAAARLGLAPRTACTEFRTDPARVVVRLDLDGPAPEDLGDLVAEDAGTPITTGRAFIFAGSQTLTGVVRVHDLFHRTAIDDVLLMGGAQAGPGLELDTQDFVRPVYRDGRLVLFTRPGPAGRIVPFEQPHPTPCCADHDSLGVT